MSDIFAWKKLKVLRFQLSSERNPASFQLQMNKVSPRGSKFRLRKVILLSKYKAFRHPEPVLA